VVRGSLAEMGVRIAGNNPHYVLRTLRWTVQCDTWTIWMCTRTVWCDMRTIRACQLALARSMVVLAWILMARHERRSQPPLDWTV
jgi:hypothetical protein